MNAVEKAQAKSLWATYFNLGTIPYWGVHVAAVVGLAMVGWSWSGLLLTVGVYYALMFFVTGAYHRYFSHRSYKTSRWFQFVLAVGSTLTIQKGPLWWAHHHRHHHRRSDKDDDLHSVRQGGFWWSHMGWILSDDFESTDYDKIKDFSKYPELVWLNKLHLIPPIAMLACLGIFGGWHYITYGGFLAITLCWHGTFTINSLAHVWGSRRYKTEDDSKNNLVLALITMGEGWHNNHHHYQLSCSQGFRWYQIDMTYYILRLLSFVGLVWDIKKAPAHIIEDRPKRAAGTGDGDVADAEPDAVKRAA